METPIVDNLVARRRLEQSVRRPRGEVLFDGDIDPDVLQGPGDDHLEARSETGPRPGDHPGVFRQRAGVVDPDTATKEVDFQLAWIQLAWCVHDSLSQAARCVPGWIRR